MNVIKKQKKEEEVFIFKCKKCNTIFNHKKGFEYCECKDSFLDIGNTTTRIGGSVDIIL